MLISTFKSIYNLFNVSSKDKTRLHLMTVNCKRTETLNQIQLTSCDGYSMIQEIVIDEDFYIQLENEINIYSSNKLFLKELLKFYKNTPSRDIPVKIENNSLKTTTPYEVSLQLCTRDYPPNVATIIPKTPENSITIAFNVAFLTSLLKGLDQDTRNKNNIIMTINADNVLTPIIVRAYGAEKRHLKACIMPLKIT